MKITFIRKLSLLPLKKLFGLKIICELQFSTKQFDLNKVLSDSYLSIWNRSARLVSAI